MRKHIFALFLCLFLFTTSTKSSFAAPVINEFSSNTSPDWIEIYNNGTEILDLSLYRIKDLTLNNKLDLSGSLGPGGFAAFDWSNKLNNGGDLIKLILISDESVMDQVSYGDQGGLIAPSSGQSGGRQTDGGSDWVIFTASTKGSINNSSSVFTPPTATPTNTPTPTKSPAPTKTPTQQKTASSQESKIPTKTPTPKISLNNTSKNPTSNRISANAKDFAKISTQSKQASQFAAIKNIKEDKDKEEIKVLGAKDSELSFVPIILGLLLIIVAGGWIVLKYKEAILGIIKIWIKK